MTKKTILILVIVALVIIGLGSGGYLYLLKLKKAQLDSQTQILEKAGKASEKITESVTQSVLPSVGTNPVESQPDINPADKANPFKNIKTNPF